MGADKEGSLARLKAVRKALVEPTIAAHRQDDRRRHPGRVL
jgi:hypothetical protein